ncbi:dCTP deaminase [Micromonospora sp. NPDC049891]|uniref:dCTP deaminase n=1 Tax=Micromonospora sp. NPDC049891 TaxID=3155655 RepID=UPI00340066E0
MLLCDFDIIAAIQSGRLRVDPYEPALLQPSSIDVRLDRHLLVWPAVDPDAWMPGDIVDPAQPQHMRPIAMTDGGYLMLPGQMLLASTVEQVTLDATLAARVEGKSSLGRLGLAVHITAGFIDPGFSGHVTLELVNHNPRPLLLRPGMRIGQLCLFTLSGPAQAPYGSAGLSSHYQGQRGPTASRSHVGWRTWPTSTAPTEGTTA